MFMSRYNIQMKKNVEPATTLKISDEIAVVYADSNNMGGIIQKMESLGQMLTGRVAAAASVSRAIMPLKSQDVQMYCRWQ